MYVQFTLWFEVEICGGTGIPHTHQKKAWEQAPMYWHHHRQRLIHRLLPGRGVIGNIPLAADPHIQDILSDLLLWFFFPLYVVFIGIICDYIISN